MIEFVPKMYSLRKCVVFDSNPGADGTIHIVSAEAWQFTVVPQPLPLEVGWWDWNMYVVDVNDCRTDLYEGQIQILP